VFEAVTEEEGGGYVAYCKELPEAIMQGDTLEVARKNLNDAIKELIAANRQTETLDTTNTTRFYSGS